MFCTPRFWPGNYFNMFYILSAIQAPVLYLNISRCAFLGSSLEHPARLMGAKSCWSQPGLCAKPRVPSPKISIKSTPNLSKINVKTLENQHQNPRKISIKIPGKSVSQSQKNQHQILVKSASKPWKINTKIQVKSASKSLENQHQILGKWTSKSGIINIKI